MDAFEHYLINLPKPSSEEETLKYKSENQPYIVDDNIVSKMHFQCGKKVNTRILKIYVPSQDIIITRNFPHYDSDDPLIECKKGFKENWAIGIDEKQEERLADIFYNRMEIFYKKTDEMDPQKRLEGIARIYKTASGFQEGFTKFRTVLDTVINSL
ncbi:MAG: hypothetical protein GY864_02625 [Desulfobacterales bacterium]|nr:hypothetical protein [Desulfobacterales bacterium]